MPRVQQVIPFALYDHAGDGQGQVLSGGYPFIADLFYMSRVYRIIPTGAQSRGIDSADSGIVK